MAGYRVDPDDTKQVVAFLKAAGIRNVSDDPKKLALPGVWVQVLGYTFDKLAGYTLNAQLALVVADSDSKRARDALVVLLNQVIAVRRPDGPVRGRPVNLPGHAPVPGLIVPLDFDCTAPPQEGP